MIRRYADGEIGREELIRLLAEREYKRPASSTNTWGYGDEPWGTFPEEGTLQEIEAAVDDGLLTSDDYDEIYAGNRRFLAGDAG